MNWLQKVIPRNKSDVNMNVSWRTSTGLDKWSADDALQNATFSNALNLITDTVSTLPLKHFKGDQIVEDSYLVQAFNKSPNKFSSSQELLTKLAKDLVLYGTAYLKKDGPYFEYLDSANMTAVLNSVNGYSINEIVYEYRGINGLVTFDYDEIITIETGKKGVLETGKDVLNRARAEREFSTSILEKGIFFGLIAKVKNKMEDSSKEILKDSIRSTFGGTKNAGNVGVFGENVSFEQHGTNISDLQLLDQKKNAESDICKLFGINESLVNSDMTKYRNDTQSNSLFLRNTISPILKAIEQALNRLLETDEYVRFDTSEILRGTPEEVQALTLEAFKAGVISVNEARKKLDLHSIEEDFFSKSIGTADKLLDGKVTYYNVGSDVTSFQSSESSDNLNLEKTQEDK